MELLFLDTNETKPKPSGSRLPRVPHITNHSLKRRGLTSYSSNSMQELMMANLRRLLLFPLHPFFCVEPIGERRRMSHRFMGVSLNWPFLSSGCSATGVGWWPCWAWAVSVRRHSRSSLHSRWLPTLGSSSGAPCTMLHRLRKC